MLRFPVFVLLLIAYARGQAPCPTTPAYSLCEIPFELNAQESAAHPNPYVSVQLHAEFRSPRHRTFLMPAFSLGGNRLLIRFAPDEPGEWDFRLTSNLERFNEQAGKFQVTASEALGFVRPANMHHWATLAGENVNLRKPHLWMGDTALGFATMNETQFRQLVDKRAAQHFTHLRGVAVGDASYADPNQPVAAHFAALDERVKYINSKGIIADLILAGSANQFTRLFPNWDQRQRFVRYLVARYAAMNVTWQGFLDFESYANGRETLKELGTLLKQHDPYGHPRGTGTLATSSTMAADGWMSYIAQSGGDEQLGAIEHQVYPAAFVNLAPAREAEVGADAFRRRLWNATMNGQYPTYSGEGLPLDAPGAQQMAHWFTFFDDTRHWELEPYFDVDGARAIALEGIEYIVYVEKPGPVEVGVERHGYDISWFNPITGESIVAKKWKGERWTGQPPDWTHDWVLHIEREGRKESMLTSYRFDSREYPLELQVPESNPAKIPFDIVQPDSATVSQSKPEHFEAKLKRETRGTRSMMYLWTAEIPSHARGFRVVGTGREGTWKIPAGIASEVPATLSLHLTALNANGKIYQLDRVYKLVP